jgi:YVTN family beta-propeller protein
VTVEPGAQLTWLAGDGDGHAAVVYLGGTAEDTMARWRCNVALIDVGSGAVERAHPVCAEGERPTGLALVDGLDGPTAFVGLWRSEGTAGTVEGQRRAARGRVVAVDMATGSIVAAHQLGGVPSALMRPPAGGPPGGPIYAFEAIPRPDSLQPEDPGDALGWHLLELHPATLELQALRVLSYPLRWPVLAPEGRDLYAAAGSGSSGPGSGGGITIVHLDLATGDLRVLADVPAWAPGGPAVTGARVYVPDMRGNRLTVLDRRTGRILTRIPTGRQPVGVAVGGA